MTCVRPPLHCHRIQTIDFPPVCLVLGGIHYLGSFVQEVGRKPFISTNPILSMDSLRAVRGPWRL